MKFHSYEFGVLTQGLKHCKILTMKKRCGLFKECIMVKTQVHYYCYSCNTTDMVRVYLIQANDYLKKGR